ncbi:CCL19 protein, partial [Trogon melanurus]|nr:CCL19 protein [Trogon melanurus]
PPPAHSGKYNCCLPRTEMPIPRWRVRDYQFQLEQDGCDFPAVVFITIKGKPICAPVESPWAVGLQVRLNARKVGAVPVLSW